MSDIDFVFKVMAACLVLSSPIFFYRLAKFIVSEAFERKRANRAYPVHVDDHGTREGDYRPTKPQQQPARTSVSGIQSVDSSSRSDGLMTAVVTSYLVHESLNSSQETSASCSRSEDSSSSSSCSNDSGSGWDSSGGTEW